MSKEVIDKTLEFTFPDNWKYTVYDETTWHKELKKIQGICSIDLILLDPDNKNLYLIEAKDYEKVPGTEKDECNAAKKIADLPQKFSKKVTGTIAGLAISQMCAQNELKRFCNALLDHEYTKYLISFVELGRFANNKKGTGKGLLANLQLKTLNAIKPICSKKAVCDIKTLPKNYGWSVTRIEQ